MQPTHTVIGVIPARYASTRLPGKPLLTIGGKSVVQHVYERAAAALPFVIVATDDQRIYDEVQRFGGRVVLTEADLKSGTDRCAQALERAGLIPEVVVNIQGDEPFVAREQIVNLVACFDDPEVDIATTVIPFDPTTPYAELDNPNVVKVVVGEGGRALYFSRSVIPHLRGVEREEYAQRHTFYKHLGMYAYRGGVLRELAGLSSQALELCESLEQLRWLSKGYCIQTIESPHSTIGIDTAADLEAARAYYERSLALGL